jgi:predicted RNase H-like HicB family nuclease
MTKRFTVVLQQGEDGMIVASCPALPGVWTQGATRDEALANAREAIELALEGAREFGESVPDEDLATIEVAV